MVDVQSVAVLVETLGSLQDARAVLVLVDSRIQIDCRPRHSGRSRWPGLGHVVTLKVQ